MASEHLKRRRLARLNAVKPVGYIYFVGAEEVRRVKIGFSYYNPNERFDILETASPVKLSKLGLMRGPLSLERELHAKFAKHRLRLEWFSLDVEILDFIITDARNWEEMIAEEQAAAAMAKQEKAERRHEEMNRQYQAIKGPTSEDYMLGRL